MGPDEQLLIYKEVSSTSTSFYFLDGYLEGNPKTLSLTSNGVGVGVGPKRHKESKNSIQKRLYVCECVGVDV